jgi:hypothetical protein
MKERKNIVKKMHIPLETQVAPFTLYCPSHTQFVLQLAFVTAAQSVLALQVSFKPKKSSLFFVHCTLNITISVNHGCTVSQHQMNRSLTCNEKNLWIEDNMVSVK